MKTLEMTKGNHLISVKVAVALLLISISLDLAAQDEKIKIQFTTGFTWRSTVMNFFNLKEVIPADPTQPYDYERNVQGLGLNPGLLISSHVISLEYYSNLRYDVVYSRIGMENVYVKDFLMDHNFNISMIRKLTYGVGISIVNFGKGYAFVNPIPRYQNIEFTTYNFLVAFPINKLMNLELKALYIPKDFPENPVEKYITYSARVYHTFQIPKKRHKSTRQNRDTKN